MPGFAAFATGHVSGLIGPGLVTNAGVHRWNCTSCGSPIAATFDYLDGQVYVPLGVIDEADDLTPQAHCFADRALDWLHMDDGVAKEVGTGRDRLLGGD